MEHLKFAIAIPFKVLYRLYMLTEAYLRMISKKIKNTRGVSHIWDINEDFASSLPRKVANPEKSYDHIFYVNNGWKSSDVVCN